MAQVVWEPYVSLLVAAVLLVWLWRETCACSNCNTYQVCTTLLKCKTLIWQSHSQPYKNLWPDWARFMPDLSHEAIFKTRPELDNQDHHFCHACVIESDNLVCLSPILWQKWGRKSEYPVHLFSPLYQNICHITWLVYYLWNLARVLCKN